MNNKEPIMDCTEEELTKLGREWQSRLFLDSWVIKFKFEYEDMTSDSGQELSGLCSFDMVNSCAIISIRKPNEDTNNRIMKYCIEQILLHELLHCKMNWLETPGTLESAYFDTKEHALLEEISKSLIMAKYNLKFEWFYNF